MKIKSITISSASKDFELGNYVFCRNSKDKWLAAKVVKITKSIFTCQYYDKKTGDFEAKDLVKVNRAVYSILYDSKLSTKEVKSIIINSK